MHSSESASPFDGVVFSGGGCRCFWAAGFWEVARPALRIEPRVVAAVSAGAAFACAAFAGTTRRVVEDFKRRSATNARNVYPRNVLGDTPVFPHESIYRGAILENLDGRSLARLHAGPDIRILVARPPAWLGTRSGFLTGMVAHILDRRESQVHARWGLRFGFEREVLTVRSCRSPADLADLILHSSCSPPLVPLYRRDGRIVLDGGLIDNAPAELTAPARRTLLLLSRHYGDHKIPRLPGRTYVQPSREIPIVKWDYTSPALIQETFDLGRRDGEAFALSYERFDHESAEQARRDRAETRWMPTAS